MSAYLVVITPETDDPGTADPAAQLSIRVETVRGATRIVEMTMRSSAPEGLSLDRLPQPDLAALGRALVAAAGAGARPAVPGAPAAPEDSAAATGDATRPAATARTPRARRTSAAPPSAPPATARKRAARPVRTGRAYRRMPDIDELLATHAEVGGVTRLAEHYGVPRHTAQGWMSRARKATS